MAGIAGIAGSGRTREVGQMLDAIAHRGRAGRLIVETDGATLGLVWTGLQSESAARLESDKAARDEAGEGHLAQAQSSGGKVTLTRDQLGVAPLYHGRTAAGELCFASEVKAMLAAGATATELPPGSHFDGTASRTYYRFQEQPPVDDDAAAIARELHRRLDEAVGCRMGGGNVGSWLSGGLDSSALAALARRHADRLETFAVGFPGAPDLDHAREVARFIGATHHELEVGVADLLRELPSAIWHLESFDAWLVRSSITNFMVARLAADHVGAVFSGEGGDELFAGYEYLKTLDVAAIPAELVDITNRLHNTALQRVDRSASAHGTVAHVAFLAPAVADYAARIPAALKLRGGVEKWILRRAMDGMLPQRVLDRPKAKFWEGAGVKELLLDHANATITDSDFASERRLPNGLLLNSKEELMYYRIFRERFGDLDDLSWVGRTKGSPVL